MRHGFALHAGTAPEIVRTSAREAEGLGYSSFWVNHPGATDGLVALAVAASETQRIDLGVGVVPLPTRGPDKIVLGVRANALPLDRLLLGVGSANPGALRRVRAGVAELRSQLAVRLVVAALGPQMCRLAGEVADGQFGIGRPVTASRIWSAPKSRPVPRRRQPPTPGPCRRDGLAACITSDRSIATAGVHAAAGVPAL